MSSLAPVRTAADLRVDDVAALAARVLGPVLRPDDPGYAAECTPRNRAVEHRPAMVVGATGAADIRTAVRFAAAHDLPVGVLATGRQAVVPSDGGLLITTRRMAGVTVDPVRRRALVEAGAHWRAVTDAAGYGLAALASSSPLVGVIGHTLGGGLSPALGRALGWAADHVHGLDVVTADGELCHVDAVTEPDLFWALRGGRANFGVVTALEFALFPVPELYAGYLEFAGADAPTVLHAYREWAAEAPGKVTSSVALLRSGGELTARVRVSAPARSLDGDALVAPLRAAAPVLADTVGRLPTARAAEIHGAGNPAGPAGTLERAALLGGLPAAAVDAILDLAGPDADCPLPVVELRQLGGALGHPPAVPNAVGGRDAAFALRAIASGPVDGPGPAYADALVARLVPWRAGGRYLNVMSTRDTGAEQVRAAYHRDTYERLRSVKDEHDPGNVFRLNHNIPPHPRGQQ